MDKIKFNGPALRLLSLSDTDYNRQPVLCAYVLSKQLAQFQSNLQIPTSRKIIIVTEAENYQIQIRIGLNFQFITPVGVTGLWMVLGTVLRFIIRLFKLLGKSSIYLSEKLVFPISFRPFVHDTTIILLYIILTPSRTLASQTRDEEHEYRESDSLKYGKGLI